MPEKKGDYSLLIYALMFIVFLALAIMGSYFILFMLPIGLNGPQHQGSFYGYGTSYFIDGASPTNQSGRLPAQNGSFSGTWQFSADSDEPIDSNCLLLAFADYNQTSLYYNGSFGKSHLLTYETPVRCNTTFNLTGLTEGFHDVTLLTIKEPYAEDRYESMYDAMGMRFAVVEGNATMPDVRYAMGLLEPCVAYWNGSGRNLIGYGPWLTHQPFQDMRDDNGMPTGNAIESMDVAPGEDVDYYINVKSGVGDTNAQLDRFALLQLLDYEQVPLRRDSPEHVYYGALGPDQYLTLSAGIKAPTTPGQHMLTLFMAGYPYEDYGEGGSMRFLMNSVTVILNVKG